MKKFYIEISEYDNPCEYVLQSNWFLTEKDAIDWAKNISFLSKEYEICLLFSEWDTENDTYKEIEVIRRIDQELKI